MSESKFKTLRHIETVRNYLSEAIRDLMYRQEHHDQSKLQDPEAATFDKYTHKLREFSFGSPEYAQGLRDMEPAISHHYLANQSHHPNLRENGYRSMNLLDLLEMIIDWECSSKRSISGDIFKSIEINQKRFGYSDELKQTFINTAQWLKSRDVYHHADES